MRIIQFISPLARVTVTELLATLPIKPLTRVTANKQLVALPFGVMSKYETTVSE